MSSSDRIRMKREACNVPPKLPGPLVDKCNDYKRYAVRYSNNISNQTYYVNKSEYLKRKAEQCNVKKPTNKKYWMNTAATSGERMNDLKRDAKVYK